MRPNGCSVTDVTPGFLPLLGVAPARGRMFEANDLGQPVVILTDAFWRAKLAADPAAIGRHIVLGGRAHTIVGVLPEQFVFPLDQVDVFRPLPLPPADPADPEARAGFRVGVMARLARNVSPTDLTAALDEVSRRSSPPAQVVATPLAVAIARGSTRTLGLLAGAAALAFLIAFANLAGLLLVQSIDRRRELAVRTALGARPSEIARQLMLEAETLVAIGIAGGVLLALWLTPVVGRLALEQFGALADREVAVSWRVIAVVAMVAAACAGLCGLLPAFVASRRNVVDVLARGVTPAPRELGLRRVFVTGVVALACVLLVSPVARRPQPAQCAQRQPRIRRARRADIERWVPAAKSPSPERVALFYSALHRALEERLGPGTVSVINELPLTHDRGRGLLRIQPTDPAVEAVRREAGTGLLRCDADTHRGRPCVRRARRCRGSVPRRGEPITGGAMVPRRAADRASTSGWGQEERPAEIIGIAGDVKHRALDAEGFWPTVYVSAWRSPSRSMFLSSEASARTRMLSPPCEKKWRGSTLTCPYPRVRSMQDVAAASPGVPARRVLTATFMGFALLAIVLPALDCLVSWRTTSRPGVRSLRFASHSVPIRCASSCARSVRARGSWERAWWQEASCRSGRRARSAAWCSRRAVSIPSTSPPPQRC